MSQKNFVVEKGLKIVDVGTDIGVEHIQGSGAPSMDAPKGSLYSDRDTGFHYQKELAGSGADKWKKIATQDDINATIGTWRPEAVVLLTAEAQAPGVRDVVVSPFSDDQGTAVPLSAFVVGKFIIADAVLLEITDVTGDNVTFAAAPSAMVKDDTFVVEYYLPDSATQENHAIVNYNGSAMVKIADADWGRADAIGLAPSYAAVNGSVTSADTVNSALEKLDGNQQDLITLSGVAQGATDLGVFTGTTIVTGRTVKAALQDLETAHESLADDVGHLVTLSGVAVDSDDLGVFTGDIIADGQTVKAAIQDLETELVDTRDNVDDLITLSGVAENSTSLDMSVPGSAQPDLFGTNNDVLFVSENINRAVSILSARLAPLVVKEIDLIGSDVGWKDLAEFPSDEGVCVKVVIMSMGYHPTTKISMISLEALLMGQGQGANGTADYTSYAKLKIDEHNGSPVDELYDLEVRGFYDTVLGKVKLQAKATAATTVDKYLQYRIQPIGYDINW